MDLFVGTSGYSYKEWKGDFYPKDLPAGEMLRYYGTRLNAVEINNTFYRFPKDSVLTGWADQVPETFHFVLKASRKITHFKRLKQTEEETAYLARTVKVLGKRLGVVFFQLPPNLKADLPRLEEFLLQIPDDLPVAFEFRHQSWFEDETFALLRRQNAALCIADADGELDVPFVSTADFGYLRLRKEKYTAKDLKAWAKRIGDESWKRCYVFFKHEDEAAGPKMAGTFLDLFS
ncbi:MAG: DUF72 domain-containing protein [Ignavibacteria bacterium]|nr:DUF72 domain-containing protein [Ignavibacteria bacterium]